MVYQSVFFKDTKYLRQIIKKVDMFVDSQDIVYQWIAYTKHNLLQYLIHDKPRSQTTNEFPKHERKPQPRRTFLPQTKYDKQNPQKSNTEAKAQNKNITDINTRDRM